MTDQPRIVILPSETGKSSAARGAMPPMPPACAAPVASDLQELDRLLARRHASLLLIETAQDENAAFDLVRRLRARHDLDIVILSAQQDEKISGEHSPCELEAASQPADMAARLTQVLNRREVLEEMQDARTVRFAGWTLFLDRHEAFHSDGATATLTSAEFALLMAFLKAPGRILGRDALAQALRGRDWHPLDRSIDVHIGHLRRKLDPQHPPSRLIRTAHGRGYLFTPQVKWE